jgi:hypothetical protein
MFPVRNVKNFIQATSFHPSNLPAIKRIEQLKTKKDEQIPLNTQHQRTKFCLCGYLGFLDSYDFAFIHNRNPIAKHNNFV